MTSVDTHRSVADIEVDLIVAIKARMESGSRIAKLSDALRATEDEHNKHCGVHAQFRDELLKAIAAKAGAMLP